MSMEILAPVGGEEQLLAAVRTGANAVYLGTKAFNARRNASNFDGEGLRRAVAFCHGRGVRVHVTCNTLLTDPELPALTDTLREIAASGADAVIVQDLAVAALLRECCPTLPLHASTQMTIHNAAGARMAKELGFSRVVLARELTLEEIAAIHREVDVELEVFVHGALCMSVSGQCWLSAMLGGRSGNRGLCAQPCRLNFRSKERDYALSLKDLSALSWLPQLEKAGVASLKIEGRMKRPEYVAAAVTACRRALAGEEPDMETLRAVFSRSGFTDGYLRGERGPEMFGVRRKEDVEAAAGVLKELAGLYRAETPLVPVRMAFEARSGEPLSLTVTDGMHVAAAKGEPPQSAQTRPTEAEQARKSLEKTGGTPFAVTETALDLAPGLYLPAASLNALRREALDKLLTARETATPHPFAEPTLSQEGPRRDVSPALRLRFETAAQLFDHPAAEQLYLPVEEIDEGILKQYAHKLTADLPRFLPEGEREALLARLLRLRELGLRAACASTLGDIELIRGAGLTVRGGFSLNILNSAAAAEYARLGLADAVLSFEIGMERARRLRGLPTGLIGYGFLPLMLFRACPMKGKKGCGGCSGREKLRDRTGTDFTVLCQRKRYAVLLNSLPLYIGDKEPRGVDFTVLYFTTEDRERALRVTEDYLTAVPPDFKRTNGLYFRELL